MKALSAPSGCLGLGIDIIAVMSTTQPAEPHKRVFIIRDPGYRFRVAANIARPLLDFPATQVYSNDRSGGIFLARFERRWVGSQPLALLGRLALQAVA